MSAVTPPLTFASIRIEREWADGRLDKRVREITLEAASFAFEELGRILELGSIYRTNAEEAAIAESTKKPTSHIHVYWRAVDIRVRNLSAKAVDAIESYLNGRWIYDPTPLPERRKLTVCFSAEHGTGPHIHVQSHPLTRRR